MACFGIGLCLIAIAFFYGRRRLASKRKGLGPNAVTTSIELEDRAHNAADGTLLPEYGDNVHGAATASPPPYTSQT
jgi:hypothetical protein